MASGDLLFKLKAKQNIGPATNFATPDVIAAATGKRLVLDFVGSGGSVDESAIFEDQWPSHYGGGGVDIVIDYSTDGTSVAEVEFELSLEVIQDQDDQDAGGQDFGTVTNRTDTPSTATTNVLDRTAVAAITHANCGSPAVGDGMRLKIARDHDHGAGNADFAQLATVYVTET